MSIGDSFDIGINSYGNNTYSYRDYLKNYLNNNNLLHKTYFYYSKSNYTIEELLNDITINKEVIYNDRMYNIKKDLREADLITISIGLDELISIIEDNKNDNIYVKVDKMIDNMNILINNVQKISSSNIILIGYYNPYLNGVQYTFYSILLMYHYFYLYVLIHCSKQTLYLFHLTCLIILIALFL